jgi:hypothetical protein
MARQPRLFPDERPSRGRARRGLDITLRELRDRDRIDEIDSALVALNRILADQLDGACRDVDESRFTIAAVAGRYHQALTALITTGAPDDLDADLTRLLAGALDDPQPRAPD